MLRTGTATMDTRPCSLYGVPKWRLQRSAFLSSGVKTTTEAAAKRPGPEPELLAAGIGSAGGKLGPSDSRISRNFLKAAIPQPGVPAVSTENEVSMERWSPENGLAAAQF